MKREVLIHKLVITAEAKYDYEEILGLGKLPKTDIKEIIEDYLSFKDEEYQACDVKYFSVKYIPDDTDDVLKLFFYKGIRIGAMQMWKFAGVCKDQDWDIDWDDSGHIRHWLKSKVDDLPKEQDWVKTLEERIANGVQSTTQQLMAVKKCARNYIKYGNRDRGE